MSTSIRKQAHDRGESVFFTGKPCKHGHVSHRYVSTGGCIECLKRYTVSFRKDRPAGVATFPAQQIHEDDHAQLYLAIDYLNAQRGLPPATRVNTEPTLPSAFEMYLHKQLRIAPSSRPSLESIERAAQVQGMTVAYSTMARPVDTWTMTPEQLAARANAQKAQFVEALEADGYAPDEK